MMSKDIIFGKSYGETKLKNHCIDRFKCTKEEHQVNRRTEFVIVNPFVFYL